MSRRALVAALPLVLGTCGQGAMNPREPPAAVHDAPAQAEIERGRYLAVLGDCGACHTATAAEPYAGGRPIATPFGTVLAANLTPDRTTGIGDWTDDDFVNAVQNGIAPGGEHLYPAMPYPYFTRMSRADVLAIRAYLATLKPVDNAVISDQLPFPFRIRASMVLWNALYFHPGVRRPIADRSDAWNRGAYLVEGPGHCGACHTPKTRLGGDNLKAALAGGEIQGWMSPNLNGDRRTGLGMWSETDIVAYLQAGTNAHAAASGPMAEVISKSTSRMSDEDLQAIAKYLKTQDGDRHDTGHAVAADDTTSRIGEAIYVDACAPCHAPSGEGAEHLFPPLKGSSIVQAQNPATLIRVVLHGTQNVATDRAPTGPSMPAFGWKLDDAQVAAVLTYVRNHWGNAASPVRASVVQFDRTAAP